MTSKQRKFLLLFLCFGFLFTACKKENTDENTPSETTNNEPTVNTLEATDVMAKSAVLHGFYSATGKEEILSAGFFLASHNAPSETDTVIELHTEEIGDSTFSCSLAGLQSNHTYYYRAFLESSKGIITGDIAHFKTESGFIHVITLPPVELSAATLLCKGEIRENEGSNIKEQGICWSESKNPTVNDNKIISSADSTIFQTEITGVDAATCHFRAFVLTDDEVFYGNEKEYTFHFIVDKRDNKPYKYVKIGEQDWLAENMAWMPELCPPDEGCGFWAPENEQDSIKITPENQNYKQFGVLYDYDQASEACPGGWRLPTNNEWQNLIVYLQEQGYTKTTGKALKSTNHWNNNGNGTDDFGFNALPAGYRDYMSQEAVEFGTQAFFWSATANVGEGVYTLKLDANSDEAKSYVAYRYGGCSVRCIKIKE